MSQLSDALKLQIAQKTERKKVIDNSVFKISAELESLNKESESLTEEISNLEQALQKEIEREKEEQEKINRAVEVVMYDTKTNKAIGPVTDGMVIDLGKTRYITFVAETGSSTKSVLFGYDSNNKYRIENGTPYSFSNNTGNDLWDFTPTVGDHTLKVTAYDQMDAKGQVIKEVVAKFKVIDSSLPPPKVYNIKKGESIAERLKEFTSGVISVEPSTYIETTFKVPFDVTLDLSGVIIDGGGAFGNFGVEGKLLQGKFQNFKNENDRSKATVKVIKDGGSLESVVFENVKGCPLSFERNNVKIEKCGFKNISGSWILFGGGEKNECLNPTITGCVVDVYNTDQNNVPSGVGVNKATRTVQLTFTNNVISNGFGPGIWLDVLNRKYTISNNKFSGIKTSGKDPYWTAAIYIEISNGEGSVISDNVIVNTGKGYPAITIAESNGVVIKNNTVENGNIEVRDVRDLDGYKQRGAYTNYSGTRVFTRTGLRDVSISNNTVVNGKVDHISAGWFDSRQPIKDSSGKITGPSRTDSTRREYVRSVNVVWKDNKVS